MKIRSHPSELALGDVVRIDEAAVLMGRSVTELLRDAAAEERLLYVALAPCSTTLMAVPGHDLRRTDSNISKRPKIVALASQYAESLVIFGFANVEKWQASFDGGGLDWHCWVLNVPQRIALDKIFVWQVDVRSQIKVNAKAVLIKAKVLPASTKTLATPTHTGAPAPAIEVTVAGDVPVIEQDRKKTGPSFTMTKAAMIEQHKHEWPTIARDIADAKRNGLSGVAKESARGWREAEAMEWARTKGKLKGAETALASAICRRRLNIDPPCRSNIDPGRVAAF